jgi:hypothetical protein
VAKSTLQNNIEMYIPSNYIQVRSLAFQALDFPPSYLRPNSIQERPGLLGYLDT